MKIKVTGRPEAYGNRHDGAGIRVPALVGTRYWRGEIVILFGPGMPFEEVEAIAEELGKECESHASKKR